AATLWSPMGVAVDAAGNLFFADNQRIRRVDTLGVITTVAGNGTGGFAGDGGLATAASLWNPIGVAVDRAGNVFIADNANNRIRRVGFAMQTPADIYSAMNSAPANVRAVLQGPAG